MVKVEGTLFSRLSAALIGGASLLVLAGAASAADLGATVGMKDKPAEGDKLEWSAYAQGTSDYVFRGLSQNRRQPAFQGGVDVSYGMFYVGTFFSKVNFDNPFTTDTNAIPGFRDGNVNGTHVEVDGYAGIKPKWGDLTFDFGFISYNYPGSKFNRLAGSFDPFYYEVKAGVSATVLKDVALSGTIFYSPDSQFNVGAATTIEGTISKPLVKVGEVELAGSATIGGVFYDKNKTPDGGIIVGGALNITGVPQDDYVYYNVGVTATFKERFSFDLRYWDSDAKTGVSPCSGDGVNTFQCGGSIVGTAKVTF